MNKKQSTKKMSKSDSQAMEIEGVNKYLAEGNGRGRLNSAATVYNGNVGYFFVGNVDVGGVKQEAILFSCNQVDQEGLLSNDDIVITELPAHPKYFDRKA